MKRDQKRKIWFLLLLLISLLGVEGCPPGGGSSTPVPTPTQGNLTVSVGFSAPRGTMCTGSIKVEVTGGTPAQSSQTADFSGKIADALDAAGTHIGCSVGLTFPKLNPGTWTIKAGVTSCSVLITVGQWASKDIWNGVCT